MPTTPLRRAITTIIIILIALTALIWGVGATLAPDRLIQRLSARGDVYDLEFFPNGKFLAATCSRRISDGPPVGNLVVWDARTWTTAKNMPVEFWTTLDGFSEDSSLLLILQSSKITLWDTHRWLPMRSFSNQRSDYHARSAILSPDGKRIASLEGPRGSTVCIRDAHSYKPIYRGSGHFALSINRFAPDSRQIACTVDFWGFKLVHILDPSKSASLRKLGASSMAFSSDGRIAVGATGKRMTLWEPKSWSELRTFPGPGVVPVGDLALSTDGRIIAVEADDQVYVYDGESGWELARFRSPMSRGRISLSPDGSKLAIPGGGEIQVWEIGSRDRLMARALFRRLTGRWWSFGR